MQKTGILKQPRGRNGFINPNTRTENEYIQNIQRQIHFMNLEIEAFRKKQKEGKNIMTLKGLSNKSSHLPLEHLIEAKDKFSEMQRKQKEEISRRENEILRLEQNQFEIKTSSEVLRTKRNDLEAEIKGFRDAQSKLIKELGVQLDALKRNNYEIFLKIKKINLAREESKKTNEQIVNQEVVKTARETIRQEILKSEFDRLKQDIENKNTQLMELNEKKKELEEVIATDATLIELEENQKLLNKSLADKENELAILNYECFKLNHLQRLAIEQKESQASERKKILEELERLRGERVNGRHAQKRGGKQRAEAAAAHRGERLGGLRVDEEPAGGDRGRAAGRDKEVPEDARHLHGVLPVDDAGAEEAGGRQRAERRVAR